MSGKKKTKDHPYDIIPRLGRAFFDAVNAQTGGDLYRDHPVLLQADDAPRQELHLRWNRGLLVEMFPDAGMRARVCAQALTELPARYPDQYKPQMLRNGQLRGMVSTSLPMFQLESWVKDFDRAFTELDHPHPPDIA